MIVLCFLDMDYAVNNKYIRTASFAGIYIWQALICKNGSFVITTTKSAYNKSMVYLLGNCKQRWFAYILLWKDSEVKVGSCGCRTL